MTNYLLFIGAGNRTDCKQTEKETIMKKFIIAAVALGALAGAAFAENRSYDLRDLDTLNAYTSDGIYLPAVKGGVSTLPMTVKKPMGSVVDHSGEHQNSTI
jgi:hypothetical protein